ncbi:wsv362 [White spot syndrome virus]|uniref:Wsv362 n=4 Tax=White spot syndrome virus TaxID=342409 RepID=Q8VAN9_WSSVS|nr:wsv362 [Shrimp white spot syndrome virus]AFX59739.1 wsv362 [White spot syndrome virus]AAL33364.1 wsv362 [Shrimp white spot syndrome virus]AAL89289.1 WSSV421 [Shrimp white spot syndrome virus]AWQ60488.1 wsv362 [Shrimp white spot syndrome virus]AWQ60933.1 wsv362 [Shrimp white spot syndrome virus]
MEYSSLEEEHFPSNCFLTAKISARLRASSFAFARIAAFEDQNESRVELCSTYPYWASVCPNKAKILAERSAFLRIAFLIRFSSSVYFPPFFENFFIMGELIDSAEARALWWPAAIAAADEPMA